MGEDILARLGLEGEQQQAACRDGCDVAVLAGAGCGKTRTLVGRYLYLLLNGLAPEEILAITFTERAGQEMRVRIRERLRDYLAAGPADAAWLERYVALDAAPIGTIHSFCARLLRAHPAEAGLDPDFAVLDENRAAALAAEAVERALVWATQDLQAVLCFPLFGLGDLRSVLIALLAQRLEVARALATGDGDVLARWRKARQAWLEGILAGQAWAACLHTLGALVPLAPGDSLDGYRLAALAAVPAARQRNAAGDWQGALNLLTSGLRRPGNAGSQKNWGGQVAEVRQAIRGLCDLYRDQIGDIAAQAGSTLDEELAAAWPGLTGLFHQAVRDYETLKAQERAVDFDDLEAGALHLLQDCPEVAAYERGQIKAVLVDEFQDTNDRQRRLIEALLGAPAGQTGRLFVVGDAKQSIYRFRGADVTVFRSVERDITAAGGQAFPLARTYRAHAGLLKVLNELLAAVLGPGEDPARLYAVPFALLQAARKDPPRLRSPFVELHVGVGSDAEEGRRVAAEALAGRLLRLHREEGVAWGEVACLFRASTHFPLYEEAFERAGIPYVTVAGAGFYGRPEVRDLLNALRAIADPDDDLALAGLLRSPAIGLSDASLYLLRWGPDRRMRGLWAALHGDLGCLELEQQARARRAVEIVQELAPDIGRQPVAAVLKRFLDRTAYRAILRLCPQTERAGRNVDKLLADAQRSGLVSVGDLMAYLQVLNGTAAREGEAPPEAGEAVQLMTVHKAKGLEFGVVAIADAAHDDRPRIPPVLLHPAWGLLVKVSRTEGADKQEGLAHMLARQREAEMQDAEERRLLYVAATRAREKLLINGHAKLAREGLALQGWLKRLAAVLGEEFAAGVPAEPWSRVTFTCQQGQVACDLYAPAPEGQAGREPETAALPLTPVEAVPAAQLPATLVQPLLAQPAEAARPATPERTWRVVPRRRGQKGPAWVTGELVHVGLRQWRFPPDPGLEPLLRAAARGAGLVDPEQIDATLQEAGRLLRRLHESDFYHQLAAGERYHEVPYAYLPEEDPGGRIDLLCRLPDGAWWLIDFKTDHLNSDEELARKVEEYTPQVVRYCRAVRGLLGEVPRLFLCFLDYWGQVRVHEVRG